MLMASVLFNFGLTVFSSALAKRNAMQSRFQSLIDRSTKWLKREGVSLSSRKITAGYVFYREMSSVKSMESLAEIECLNSLSQMLAYEVTKSSYDYWFRKYLEFDKFVNKQDNEVAGNNDFASFQDGEYQDDFSQMKTAEKHVALWSQAVLRSIGRQPRLPYVFSNTAFSVSITRCMLRFADIRTISPHEMLVKRGELVSIKEDDVIFVVRGSLTWMVEADDPKEMMYLDEGDSFNELSALLGTRPMRPSQLVSIGTFSIPADICVLSAEAIAMALAAFEPERRCLVDGLSRLCGRDGLSKSQATAVRSGLSKVSSAWKLDGRQFDSNVGDDERFVVQRLDSEDEPSRFVMPSKAIAHKVVSRMAGHLRTKAATLKEAAANTMKMKILKKKAESSTFIAWELEAQREKQAMNDFVNSGGPLYLREWETPFEDKLYVSDLEYAALTSFIKERVHHARVNYICDFDTELEVENRASKVVEEGVHGCAVAAALRIDHGFFEVDGVVVTETNAHEMTAFGVWEKYLGEKEECESGEKVPEKLHGHTKHCNDEIHRIVMQVVHREEHKAMHLRRSAILHLRQAERDYEQAKLALRQSAEGDITSAMLHEGKPSDANSEKPRMVRRTTSVLSAEYDKLTKALSQRLKEERIAHKACVEAIHTATEAHARKEFDHVMYVEWSKTQTGENPNPVPDVKWELAYRKKNPLAQWMECQVGHDENDTADHPDANEIDEHLLILQAEQNVMKRHELSNAHRENAFLHSLGGHVNNQVASEENPALFQGDMKHEEKVRQLKRRRSSMMSQNGTKRKEIKHGLWHARRHADSHLNSMSAFDTTRDPNWSSCKGGFKDHTCARMNVEAQMRSAQYTMRKVFLKLEDLDVPHLQQTSLLMRNKTLKLQYLLQRSREIEGEWKRKEHHRYLRYQFTTMEEESKYMPPEECLKEQEKVKSRMRALMKHHKFLLHKGLNSYRKMCIFDETSGISVRYHGNMGKKLAALSKSSIIRRRRLEIIHGKASTWSAIVNTDGPSRFAGEIMGSSLGYEKSEENAVKEFVSHMQVSDMTAAAAFDGFTQSRSIDNDTDSLSAQQRQAAGKFVFSK
jgi:hypothetical protein